MRLSILYRQAVFSICNLLFIFIIANLCYNKDKSFFFYKKCPKFVGFYKRERKENFMQEKKSQTNFIQIFSDGFDSGVSVEKVYVTLYNKLFQTYTISGMFKITEFLDKLKEEYKISDKSILLSKETSKSKKFDETDTESAIYIIELKPEVLLELRPYRMDFYYSNVKDKKFVTDLTKKIELQKRKKKHKKKFCMLARSHQADLGYELQKFKIKKMDVDVALSYNDDFMEVHQSIQSFLKDDKRNGIIMLHGKYGTGKSTYIRYLLHEANNRFIFLPLYMVNELSSPELLPFLSRYPNSVLILEDCEDLLRPRNVGNYNNQALVNLLNLGDGLLSDALSIKLICTFNADLQKIDPAIMRKGRLAASYEFKPLEIEKAKKLAKKYKFDIEIEKPLTLAEIFNAKQKISAKETQKQS